LISDFKGFYQRIGPAGIEECHFISALMPLGFVLGNERPKAMPYDARTGTP